MDDVRYAFRQLRTHPAFAAVAVATLAVGIGSASAMFGLIQGVLLSPPPYAEPDRLVLVSPARVDGQPFDRGSTVGQWLAWRTARSLERPALYRWTFNFLVRGDGSRSLGGMVVTRDFFDVVGVRPLMGRTFTAAEASRPGAPGKPGAPPTAILLGYDLWQREFGGDPAIVGKAVTLSRMPAPLPVVGVMPPGLRFLPDPGAAAEPNYDLDAKVDFWLAMTVDETAVERGAGNVVARLKPGATAADAQAEVAAMSAGVAKADPRLAGLTATARPVRAVLNAEGERLLVPLFGAVGLLFLIACANVSGLLLARGLQRQQEYATRAAMGAGRARLFRLVLIEAVAIALTAAAARRRPGLGDRRGAARHRRSRRPSGRRRRRRLAGPALRRPRRARGRHRRRAAAGAARVVGRSLHPAQGIAHDGRPRRAAAPGRRGRRPGGAHRLAPRRRGAARAHRPEARRRPPGLRHRADPGDDGHARRRSRPGTRLPRAGARAGRGRSRRPPRRLRLGPAAHRQQLAGRARSGRPRQRLVGDRRSHQPAGAIRDRGLLRGHGHAAGRGPGVLPQRQRRRAARRDRQRRVRPEAPGIGTGDRAAAPLPGQRQADHDRRRPRRHADRAAARAAGAGAVPAVLAERRLLEAPRPADDRRSAARGPAGPRCAARHPADGRRGTRDDDGRDPPRSRPPRRRSRCGCWPASRWSRRCWPRSASTACCRCRWGRGRRNWRCGRRSGRAGTR